MGSVTSSMTEAELEAAFHTNVNYLEDNSTAKAAAFISVCRALLIRPSSTGKGSFSASWNRQVLEQMANQAQEWLEARDTSYRPGPTVRSVYFKRYRNT